MPCLVLPPSSTPPRYTRASFLFPEQQPAPHTSFDQECDALKSACAGLGSSSAYVLGDGLNGLQWHVFVAGEEPVPVAFSLLPFGCACMGGVAWGLNGLQRHVFVAEPVPAAAQPACWWAQLLARQARPWNAGWFPLAVLCLISPAWLDLRAGTENAHATTEKPLYTLEVRLTEPNHGLFGIGESGSNWHNVEGMRFLILPIVRSSWDSRPPAGLGGSPLRMPPCWSPSTH